MLVQYKKLQHWKTEHLNPEGCQDACELAPERGLFAVTDGAGTTLFPAIWARILAKHFIDIPLMSDDPFEVEWWVRLAQEQYKEQAPKLEQLLDWSVRAKAQNQGSDSTLATLRIIEVDASSAQAKLLVFGDSCVIIGNNHTHQIEQSFVLQHPAEFNQAPICIPSTLKFFNRDFNRCSIASLTLQPHHIVILATDAVSKWILAGGSGPPRHAEPWDAFKEVAGQPEEDAWRNFIARCRENKEMVDDDATALVLTFKEDGHGEGTSLAATNDHSYRVSRAGAFIDVTQERKEALERAQRDDNKELVAVYYGDGQDLKSLVDIPTKEISRAREVAHALKEVLRAFRYAQNSPDLVARVTPIWRQYALILQDEKCAQTIRETLRRNGVNMQTPVVPGAAVPGGNAIAPALSLPAKSESLPPEQAPPSSNNAPDELEKYKLKQELEKRDLELHFRRVLGSKNDDEILTASQAIEAARGRYPDLPAFTEGDLQHIELARKRKMARENLQQAGQSKLVEDIAAAYAEYDAAVIDMERLTPTEREQVALAPQLAQALKNEDDSLLLTLYRKVQHRDIFTFTEAEKQLIDLAQQRLEAFGKFQVALSSKSLPTIAGVYDLILDNSLRLTERERQLLALAREFVAAWNIGEDASILAVCEKINQSPYQDSIAFTQDELKRINRAEANKKIRMQIIAVVKNERITLEQLRKVCRVYQTFYHYELQSLQRELEIETDQNEKQSKISKIKNINEGIQPMKFVLWSLEEIINDKLLQTEVEREKQQGEAGGELEEKMNEQLMLYLDTFKNLAVTDYASYLQVNSLTEDDIEMALSIWARPKALTGLIEKRLNAQQERKLSWPWAKEPKSFAEWLERQRKDAGIVYLPSDMDDARRGQWLLTELEKLNQ